VDGIITTVAGTGVLGFGGDGGPATQAHIAEPTALAVGPDGSLYIADSANNRVRRAGVDGIITTVAGTGVLGFGGDGGPATQAHIAEPSGLAVSPDGSLYIADYWNMRIRRIAPDGIITTIAEMGRGLVAHRSVMLETEVPRPKQPSYCPLNSACPDGSIFTSTEDNRIRRMHPMVSSAFWQAQAIQDSQATTVPQPKRSFWLETKFRDLATSRTVRCTSLTHWNVRIRRVMPDGNHHEFGGQWQHAFCLRRRRRTRNPSAARTP